MREALTLEDGQKAPLCAVVLTYNEEKNIGACLESVANWCEQVFVVDSGSTDRTLEICRRHTDLLFFHPYVDHASQWEWALSHLPLSHEWIVPLDADHVISTDLRGEIVGALRAPDADGYYSRHRYFFMGSPIRGFKPYSLRLFRRSRTRVDHSELVDFRFVVDGQTRRLSGATLESNQNESSIDFWLDKHQKFSSRMAVEEVLRQAGIVKWSVSGRLLGNPDERIIWFKNIWYHMPLYVRPFIYFFYRYILRLGFLDGTCGFQYHFLQAFWFRFIIDMKIADLRRKIANGDVSVEELKMVHGHESWR